MLGGQEKRKEEIMEKKVEGFSSASLFPARKRETVTQGVTRRTQEAGSSKAGRTSETASAFQIYSHKTRITRARA